VLGRSERVRAWIRSLEARAAVHRRELSAIQSELEQAQGVARMVDACQPAPMFDASSLASVNVVCNRHGIGIDLRTADGWLGLAPSSSASYGTAGISATVSRYHGVARLVRASRNPSAPCAVRLLVGGHPCEGFATGPVEPYDWLDPVSSWVGPDELGRLFGGT
jgi:hypothetical protein